MSVILGIDPGKTGAVVRFDTGTRTLRAWRDFNHEYDLVAAIVEGSTGCQHAVVELVHSMPKQGVVSSFTFGYWTGAAVAACKAMKLTVHRPTPQTWQRELLRGGVESSRAVALRLFSEHASLFSRVKDHGTADAALMAYWLRYVVLLQSNTSSKPTGTA